MSETLDTLSKFRALFMERLEKQTNWERNQLYKVFDECEIETMREMLRKNTKEKK